MHHRKALKWASRFVTCVVILSTVLLPYNSLASSEGLDTVHSSNPSTSTANTPSTSSGTDTLQSAGTEKSNETVTTSSSMPDQTSSSTSATTGSATDSTTSNISSSGTNSSSASKNISNVDVSFPVESTTPTSPRELEEKRTAYSDSYLNQDNTFSVKSYLDPINYKDSGAGKWLPIDSTLTLHSDGTYHNTANSFDVSLPSVGNNVISFSKDKNIISFQPMFASIGEKLLHKNTITYKSVGTNTDLSYAITSRGLKESIILNNLNSPTTFAFKLNMHGLTYEQKSDGSVYFYQEGSSTPVFYILKPFMKDAKNQLSSDVSYQFQKDESGNLILQVVVNPNWLNDAKRSFPVVIDPSIEYYDYDSVGDTMISQSNPSMNYNYYSHNYVGGASSSFGAARSLFWFWLPTLPTGAVVNSATLNVVNSNLYVTDQTPTIEVHRITSNWQGSSVTWNSQPSKTSTADETYQITNQSPDIWYLPMTSIVKSWYSGKYANQGIELNYSNESQVLREMIATDDTNDPDSHPCITINYTLDGIGTEPFWTFDGPVNMANMNLVLPETDISFPGRRMAVPLSRTYNSRLKTQGVFGYGWSSPLDIRLYALSGQIASLIGSNGTTYTFNRDPNGSYDSPPGMYYSLNVVSSTKATLTTEDKTVYTFVNVPGTTGVYELSQVQDANGNTLTYNYNGSNQVTSIQDGAGHTIHLTYNASGLVATATDPAGKQTSYGYDSNKNLTMVTQPDQKSEQYRYDGNHNLTASVSPGGQITYCDYQADSDNSSSFRVSAINPKNMVTNGNFEVSSGTNHLPDHFSFYSGYNSGSIDTTNHKFGSISFKIDTSSGNPQNYGVYLSDPISVNPNTAYTLSGYLKGSQSSGTLTTVLSMYAYDANGNNLGEIGRTALNGTFDFQSNPITFTFNPANGTGLPSGTTTLKIRISASEVGGSGSSWFDGIQLEEGTTATSFVCGSDYNYYPPNNLTAAYDGDGRKNLYTYNNDQNLTQLQQDPSGLNITDKNNWSGDRVNTTTDSNGNLWSYTNDPSTGNLLQSTNPNNDSESYTYDNNSDVLQHTLVNGTTEKFTYDSTKDQLTSHDSYNTTLASTYDAYGNTTSTSNPVGLADNLIDNSSFEEGTQSDGITPLHFSYSEGKIGTWGLNTQKVISGKKSLSIVAQGGTSQPVYSVLVSDPISGNNSIGFFLSGYLMAAQSSGNQVTVLSVNCYDSNGNYLGEVGRIELDGASEWQRYRTMILPSDFPYGTTQLRVKVASCNTTGYGNSYFDDIQFQQNIVDTAYNLVDNSSFERGTTWANDWNPSTYGTDSWVTSPTFAGGHAVSITNATAITGIDSSNYWLYDSNKSYTLTAFVKTSSLSTNVGQIKIDEYDSNKNQIGNAVSAFIGGTTDWTMLTATLPAGTAVAGTVYIRPVLATGNATGTIYFDNVRLTEENPSTTNNQYDSTSSWVTSTTDPLGNKTQYQYDASGNLKQTTDAMGNTTYTTYDLMNRVSTVTVPGNDVMLSYTYDNDGNVTGITTTDPNKTTTYNSIGLAYTKTGQEQSYTDPLGKQTTYNYTPGGLLQQVNLPTGDNESYTYDKVGRLTNISYNGSDRYDLKYDNNGNLTTIVDKVLGITYTATYDKLNRLTSWTDGTRTVSYTLDASGNITQKKITVGSTTTQNQSASYNNNNQIKTLTDSGATNRFMYNENGTLSVVQTGNNIITRIDYDNNGRITNVVNQTKTGSIINSYRFTYNADGHITSITDSTGTTLNYTYNVKGMLATETLANGDTITYTYDVLGNRIKKQETNSSGAIVSTVNYTYNKDSELTQVGNTTYTYNENGEETSNGTKKFKWDASGRLIEVDNMSGTAVAVYKYDSSNRLVQKTVNGNITKYLYDGSSNHVLAEYDGSGNQTKYYTWGPNGLLSITMSGKTYYAVHNGHGDIVALTDANGKVLVTYKYDTWGNVVPEDNSGVGLAMANPYRYADYRYDDTVGLYYLMARWYDPTIGRFLSQDLHSTLPNYVYGANNPISYIDPTGYDLMSFIKGVVNGVAEGLDEFANATMGLPIGLGIGGLAESASKLLGEVVEEAPKVVSEVEKGVEEAYTAGKNFVEDIVKGPYSQLKDSKSVGSGKSFTYAQKKKIIKENMKSNGGVVKSDLSGEVLTRPVKSMSGVNPSPFEWQIDHIIPKSKGGTNSFSNAQVLSRTENRAKWDSFP